MNTRTGQILSILLIVGLTLFWSVSILGAEVDAGERRIDTDAAQTSVELATDATEEAVDEAVESIANASKLDLDLSLIGRKSVQVAAN